MLLTWHCTSSSSTWTSSNLCLVIFVDFNSYQTLRSLSTDLPKAVYTLLLAYQPLQLQSPVCQTPEVHNRHHPHQTHLKDVWGCTDNLMTNSETTARSSVLLNQWGWLRTSGGSHAQHKPAWLPGGYCRSWEMKTSASSLQNHSRGCTSCSSWGNLNSEVSAGILQLLLPWITSSDRRLQSIRTNTAWYSFFPSLSLYY